MANLKEMEKENAQLKEKIAGLEKALAEAKTIQASTGRPSKSRAQAEQVKAILDRDGKITKEQLTQINQKYPSDGIYYYKNLLKGVVIRQGQTYWTPEALMKAEEAKKAPAPAPAQTEPQQPAA